MPETCHRMVVRSRRRLARRAVVPSGDRPRRPGSAPRHVLPPQATRSIDSGQSTVEVALVLPVVALLLLAVVQVGLVVRASVLVTHVAREAVRAAAVEKSEDAPLAAAQAAAGKGLDPLRLTVEVDRAGAAGRVEVRVRYAMATDVPLVGLLVGDLDLEAEATMRVEAHDSTLGR